MMSGLISWMIYIPGWAAASVMMYFHLSEQEELVLGDWISIILGGLIWPVFVAIASVVWSFKYLQKLGKEDNGKDTVS